MRQFHPSPTASARLICFPHAGGSASFFFPVSIALTPDIEILAIQYPGRQDRRAEKRIEDLGELTDRVVQAIVPWCGSQMVLFGHSMGAILAFEVARRLERMEDVTSPLALIVSGRRGPSTCRVETVHRLSDEGITAEMQYLSGTSSKLLDDQDVVQMILPAMRSDYKAIETYRYEPGPKLSCPILALTGDNDPKATIDEVTSWEQHTSGEFELQVYPGGHFYLNDRPAEVIKEISKYVLSQCRVIGQAELAG